MNKRVLTGSNAFIGTVLAAAAAVLIFAICARHDTKLDLTKEKLYTLSPQTIQVLKGLGQQIRFLCFFADTQPEKEQMQDLLGLYQAASRNISVEFIDPDKKPYLAKQYNVRTLGIVIAICGSREEKLSGTSENDITNLLIKLTREGSASIYCVTGHGERAFGSAEKMDYGSAKDSLSAQGYEVKDLSLATAKEAPKNAAAIIIAGPAKDFLKEELDILDSALKQGTSLMVLLDQEQTPNLEAFLLKFGIVAGKDIVIDRASRVFGGDYLVPVILQYRMHPITKNFTLYSFFPTSRTISKAQQLPEGCQVEELAFTSAGEDASWAETNFEMLKEGKAQLDPEDRPGPVNITCAAAVNIRKFYKDDKLPGKQTRIVVAGDSDFACNSYINLYGNKDFFLNSLNWLAEQENLISISPKKRKNQPVILSPDQARAIFVVPVLLMPALVVGIGIAVYLHRRSL